MEKEIFKDIPNYEGIYQVSNLGNVKSLKFEKEKILKTGLTGTIGSQYLAVNLFKNGKVKMFRVHQLVAIVFLKHKPCGHNLVIDHIDSNSLNNNLNNLRLVTNRENTSKEKTIKKGLPACIYLHKPNNKYRVRIRINGKNTHLGYFKNILDAENAYFKQLNQIKNGEI